MPELSTCLAAPPGTESKQRAGNNGRQIQKDARSKAADAWSSAGISIQTPRPPARSLEKRFQQPLIKVDITTGAVLADRWPVAENVTCLE